jgi:transcriptional regulator with XRE-family HTH domain
MAIHHNLLRKYRKSAHLSQRELARLIGLRSQGVLSEIEAGLKRPGLDAEVASEIVFGSPLRELYPDLYAKAERDVLVNARQLHGELAPKPARSHATAYLAALISRLSGANALV